MSLAGRVQSALQRTRRAVGRSVRGPLGIDLALEQLHIVQFERQADGRLTLLARASRDYDGTRDELLADPGKLKSMLGAALKAGRFRGRSAVVGMPPGLYRTMSVNYRSRSDVDDDHIIASQMAERLDGQLEEYVLDFVPVRSQTRDAEKLAVVAVSRRDDVIALLDALHSAGLSVLALEIGPIAVRRLVNALPGSESQLVLVLNTGREVSYLTMLSGRRLLLDQAVQFSQSRLLQSLCDALGISTKAALDMVMRTGLHAGDVQLGKVDDHRMGETGILNTLLEILKPDFRALVEEIDRAFMYAAAQTRGGGDARIVLLGALARWPGTEQVLAGMTHLPVTALPNPVLPFDDDERPGFEIAAPELAVATGLALYKLGPGDEH